jgi:hypothetical protein
MAISKITNSGIEVIHVDDTNKRIGIGTTSPSRPIHIKGAEQPLIMFEDTDGDGDYSMIGGDTVGNLILYADHGNGGSSTIIRFFIDGSERARIDSLGNLLLDGEGGSNVTVNAKAGSTKVWVNYDGTASGAASRDSYNVSSMADRGTGKFTVNINNDMNNDDYSPAMSGSLKDGAGNDTNILVMGTDRDYANPLYTGYFYIHCTYRNAPTTTYHDGGNNYAQVVGDLA